MNTTSMGNANWILSTMLCAVVALAPVYAARGGNGGGKDKGGGGGGAGGEITPVEITFVDEMGELGYRISGDGLGPYVHDADGSGDGVQAYLGGGGAYGDIFLRLGSAPGRGLWFDFSDCHPDTASCTPPFAMGVDLDSSLAVAPGDVVADGLFGMTAGQTIHAPMEFTYGFGSASGPGFVYFDSDLKGKNPCRNKTLNATVTRPTAANLWTVSVDATAVGCATLPGGSLSGQYLMPFHFTVEIVP
jgi:hypothetical protein